MTWDIYGQRLEPGHCEVHPHVHQEYPCELCLRQQDEAERDRKAYDAAMQERAEAHYRAIWAEAAGPWFDPNHEMNQ